VLVLGNCHERAQVTNIDHCHGCRPGPLHQFIF
jgi:hypothetical protein